MAATNIQDQPPGFSNISPTLISSDVLNGQMRITNPLIGISRTPHDVIGGKTWGEQKCTYGGMGSAAFRGKTQQPYRDITRHHSHYGSGFSRYHHSVQPDTVTSLQRSDCRCSDQYIPNVNQTEISLDTVHPINGGIPIDRYYSHKSIHAVFPTKHPERISGAGTQLLSPRARHALNARYQYMYDTSWHNEKFPDYSEHNVSSHAGSDEKTLQQYTNTYVGNSVIHWLAQKCMMSKPMPFDESPLMDLLMAYVYKDGEAHTYEFYMVLEALCLFSETETARQMQINLNTYPVSGFKHIMMSDATMQEKVEKVRHVLKDFWTKSKIGPNIPQCSDLEPYSTCKYKNQMFQLSPKTNSSETPKVPLEGVSPIWPLGHSYTLDNQYLKIRSANPLHDPDPYLKKKTCNKKPAIPECAVHERHNIQCPKKPTFCCKAPVFGAAYKQENTGIFPFYTRCNPTHFNPTYGDACIPMRHLPSSIAYQDKKHVANGSVLISYANPMPSVKQQLAPYEATDPLGRKTYIPPVPLKDCVYTAGDRIQDGLGLMYRTEAQKRLHAQYSDSVPDLRDNRVRIKRQYFNGYHSSVYHG